MKRENWINKADAEIMNWFYEVIRINFGVDMIQDSSELREILGNLYDSLTPKRITYEKMR